MVVRRCLSAGASLLEEGKSIVACQRIRTSR